MDKKSHQNIHARNPLLGSKEDIYNRCYNGMLIFSIIYIPFTIFQAIGFIFYPNADIMNQKVGLISVYINVIVALLGLSFLFICAQAKKGNQTAQKLFYPGITAAATFLLLAWIIHLHLAGSQNTMIFVVVLTTLLVFSWFLRWKELLIAFVLGHIGIAVVVFLEFIEVLPYAPLIADSEPVRRIFLDWRIVVMNTAIYLTNGAIVISILYRIREALEKHQKNLTDANDQLRIEIQERKKTEEEKERLIIELRGALAHVKQLKGLLPICASCKKVRDDKGYWNYLETYLREYSDATITHSLCPDCIDKLYPDLHEKD